MLQSTVTIGTANCWIGWPGIAMPISAMPQQSSSIPQWSQDASSAAQTSRRCSPQTRKSGAASTAGLTTMGRRVCRMWRSSQRQIQGTCFAKDTRRNTRAGHSDMHTATCRSRVLQRRGSRHISKPAASIAFPTWTKTGMLQRHWLLLLQSTVVTATLVGSIQRLRT